ncbi:2Fe-2S iron-sulfur cluster-binding protein, partial [Undibacterium luofuense]
DCGGVCACGTCHVILDSRWLTKLGSHNAEEDQMLSMFPERQTSSRLACQIKVSAEMGGMIVQLPEFQM